MEELMRINARLVAKNTRLLAENAALQKSNEQFAQKVIDLVIEKAAATAAAQAPEYPPPLTPSLSTLSSTSVPTTITLPEDPASLSEILKSYAVTPSGSIVKKSPKIKDENLESVSSSSLAWSVDKTYTTK